MLEQLKSAANYIFEMASRNREEAVRVRKTNIIIQEALEKNLINEVKEKEINGKICAVDGGLLAQEMHGVDLIIARGAGVCFTYENSKLIKSEYYPDPFPKPEYSVKIGLDEHEINAYRSLFRLRVELDTALNTIEKFKPEIMMMDGSLIPLGQDRPLEGSVIFEEYRDVIEKYKKLYELCEKNNCLLLGVIKDSRGRRFMDSIKPIVNIKSADTVFLNHLLKEKERTFVIRMSNEPKKHLIMRDLEEWPDKLNLFYIKSVKDDRPMRIEFLSSTHSFDETASSIYSLSAISKNYAYPAILIEADLRAMLDQREMERMHKTLQMFSSRELMPLRRNSRPFR